MFKFETVRIFIIVHFRKNKKEKKKKRKKPVAGPFPGRLMREAFAGALSSVPLAGGD
jgi:hypothetical protein